MQSYGWQVWHGPGADSEFGRGGGVHFVEKVEDLKKREAAISL